MIVFFCQMSGLIEMPLGAITVSLTLAPDPETCENNWYFDSIIHAVKILIRITVPCGPFLQWYEHHIGFWILINLFFMFFNLRLLEFEFEFKL